MPGTGYQKLRAANTHVRRVKVAATKAIVDSREDMRSPHDFAWPHCAARLAPANVIGGAPRGSTELMTAEVSA